EIDPNGGSNRPELDSSAEGVLFVVAGEMDITIEGEHHHMTEGGYAFLPPGCDWTVHNNSNQPVRFHWVRKAYQFVDGLEVPPAFVTNENELDPIEMPDTDGGWATTRFVSPEDMRHDMHVNIVTFQPGSVIPFDETHVMEHGLYVLQGKAVYHLNQDWVEVEAGDFMWLRAFCPQS
ncbi:(S)-ureidoglycine aminohydrolase, partial [Photobacterium sanctipauli]